MTFQADPKKIQWRLHLKSPIHQVYAALATDAGRAGFWAESAEERDGVIHFVFPNGWHWAGRIVEAVPPIRFSVQYIGDTTVAFDLSDDGSGGTDLSLTDSGVSDEYRGEVVAGWISVLMALKANVDHGVDLRNHDPERTWEQGYAEN